MLHEIIKLLQEITLLEKQQKAEVQAKIKKEEIADVIPVLTKAGIKVQYTEIGKCYKIEITVIDNRPEFYGR